MSFPLPLELLPLAGHRLTRPLLDRLAHTLAESLAIPVRIAPPLLLHPEGAAGDFLSSDRIIDRLIERTPDPDRPDRWTLALSAHDLRAPGRTFVFGEAILGGAWAVVSTARLREGPGGPRRFFDRLRHEALHELGHLAGLDHCPRSACLMHPAASVEEIDLRSGAFCPPCLLRVRRPEIP